MTVAPSPTSASISVDAARRSPRRRSSVAPCRLVNGAITASGAIFTLGIDHRGRRVDDRHAGQHVALVDLALGHRGDLGQLRPDR